MDGNKNHWYDGWFYDIFIAPNQDKAFSYIKGFIELNSSLLDIGCGTGRLAFQLNGKCSRVDSIDPSIKNINIARKRLKNYHSSKIHFYHSDINTFLKNDSPHYDYAVLSYVIHEIDETQREDILRTVSQYVDTIILVDYLAPKPSNFWRYLNEIVEFAAGKDHYRNFKSYIKNNGIKRTREAEWTDNN